MQANQILTMLMNQLKVKNPQMAQLINQASQNNVNPMELFKQVTSKYDSKQMENLMTQARNMGFPSEILEQVQQDIKN